MRADIARRSVGPLMCAAVIVVVAGGYGRREAPASFFPPLVDSAGHHATQGAIRLPIPLVNRAQSELQRLARPCIDRARQRGLRLRSSIRVESILQVNLGQVRFQDARITQSAVDPQQSAVDPQLERCLARAFERAAYSAEGTPEGALATLSGVIRITPN